MQLRSVVVLPLLVTAAFAACEEPRYGDDVAVYVGEVDVLLKARCVRCHADFAPAGGWRADSYLGVIGCVGSGEPAALLSALDRADHAGLVSKEERAALASWVAAGSPRSRGGIHGASFADPRAPQSHGRLLRSKRYAPMLDGRDDDACGTCHDGAPSRPPEIVRAAPDAPSCTSCHVEPEGVLACSTCHGANGRAYPPRDRCFFANDADEHAHAAHVEPSASRAVGLACGACHPTPSPGQFSGLHADGYLELAFDYGVAGREARIDADRRCSGTCHARGGARPSPSWSDAPMTCNDCHASPPPAHYRGPCTNCHREANATGTALSKPVLHANGSVDLGDGSGRCGACHGRGDDPWPDTGAHQAHASSTNARAVACETCHAVPNGGERHPEGRGQPSIQLAGLATRGGRRATYDATTKTCAGTYCHEGAAVAPRWTDRHEGCATCHATPPPRPHSQSTTCGGATCHEGNTIAGVMSAAGKAVHVNGVIDR